MSEVISGEVKAVTKNRKGIKVSGLDEWIYFRHEVSVERGDVVSVTYTTRDSDDGRTWYNGSKVVQQSGASTKSSGTSKAKLSSAADPTRESIERQTALKAAVEYAVIKKLSVADTIKAAEEFVKFLSSPRVVTKVVESKVIEAERYDSMPFDNDEIDAFVGE